MRSKILPEQVKRVAPGNIVGFTLDNENERKYQNVANANHLHSQNIPFVSLSC